VALAKLIFGCAQVFFGWRLQRNLQSVRILYGVAMLQCSRVEAGVGCVYLASQLCMQQPCPLFWNYLFTCGLICVAANLDIHDASQPGNCLTIFKFSSQRTALATMISSPLWSTVFGLGDHLVSMGSILRGSGRGTDSEPEEALGWGVILRHCHELHQPNHSWVL
jgi:hypothetical protein